MEAADWKVWKSMSKSLWISSRHTSDSRSIIKTSEEIPKDFTFSQTWFSHLGREWASGFFLRIACFVLTPRADHGVRPAKVIEPSKRLPAAQRSPETVSYNTEFAFGLSSPNTATDIMFLTARTASNRHLYIRAFYSLLHDMTTDLNFCLSLCSR